MIQEKIDRIGDFRFRLRGWIVTLVTAVAAAALSARLSPIVFLLGLVAVFAFQRMETRQTRWERALGNRAAILERELQVLYDAPGTVDVLARAARHYSTRWSDSKIFYGLMYLVAMFGLLRNMEWSSMRRAMAVVSAPILTRLCH